ncbi:MAG TPA: patatin-like phospholipase family protein [Terracidiphilus sp.]|nr:patatin-like phospholipase family protein [Terracidiphilus sp.]
MPKRLAITIAGAVSLGSYEAGVLYEVVETIRRHNANTADPAAQIEIDVLTGASAGGMTAIILGQKLLYCGPEFLDANGAGKPYDNPLYNTWVKRISLAGLQDTQADEPALHSIFSSDLINQISSEVIMSRYATNPPSPAGAPHPVAAATIRIGVAVSNLNGVDYGYTVKPDGHFIYIDYADQFTRVADGPNSDNQAFWAPLHEAAVACGAFPFAFRAKDLQRSAKNEPFDYPPGDLLPWTNDPQLFTYSDGGIFQNQPLGIAKNLVDEFDPHQSQDSRFYLFVSPNAKDATANDNFHEKNADYVQMARRLATIVIGQSSFHDWINAEDVNKKIALLDARSVGLKDAILGGKIDVPALLLTAESLLALFFPGGSHTPPGASKSESLDDARTRIATQYKVEMAALGNDAPQAIAFRDAVLAFESAAGLGARDHMEIYGVTATDSELAGAGLCAFLGFFDQKFRDHDYDVGRSHARNMLQNAALGQPGAIGPLNPGPYPDDIHTIDQRLNGLKLHDVPPADMNAFKAGLKKRVNQMMKEQFGNWSLLADPVVDQIVSVAMDKMADRM